MSAEGVSADNSTEGGTMVGDPSVGTKFTSASTGPYSLVLDIPAAGVGDYGGNGTYTWTDENVAIGFQAGDSFTSQSANTVIGKDAAQASNAGNIVAVGYKALEDCGSDGTVGIGHSAGMNITSGAGNVAVGYRALSTTTDGYNNTAIGHDALRLAPDGTIYNTAVGHKALEIIDNVKLINLNELLIKNALINL